MAKPKFTKEQVEQALTETHGGVAIAAQRLGCSAPTIYAYLERYPDIKETVTHFREMRVDLAELRFEEAINRGEPWAVAMALKTLGKNRGYVERQEMTGADGAPLVKGYVGISPDDWDKEHEGES